MVRDRDGDPGAQVREPTSREGNIESSPGIFIRLGHATQGFGLGLRGTTIFFGSEIAEWVRSRPWGTTVFPDPKWMRRIAVWSKPSAVSVGMA
jgi:hypothetical protein